MFPPHGNILAPTVLLLLLGSAHASQASAGPGGACTDRRANGDATRYQRPPGLCPRKNPVLSLRQTCRPVVDERTPPERWGPWTHRPQCVGRRDASSEGGKFCVYTSSFAGAHGISVVTRPETAAGDIVPALETLYASTFPSNETVIDLAVDDAYDIVDIPGKGKGVRARRRIRELETFMVDYASLITDLDFPASVQAARRSRMLMRAVNQLAIPAEVFGLARSSQFGDELVEDIMGTNAFNAKLANLPYKALYPLISRINHACKPNAFFRYASSGLRAGVGALRDIEPGEELTISYTPIHLLSAERHALISNQWGFKCDCTLCTASPEQIAASDANRERLFRTKELFAEAIKSRRGAQQAIEHLFELLRTLIAEDLPLLLREPYGNLARIYKALGRMEEAREFVALKLEALHKYNFLDPREREADRLALMREYGMLK